jgi:hypothetical protein
MSHSFVLVRAATHIKMQAVGEGQRLLTSPWFVGRAGLDQHYNGKSHFRKTFGSRRSAAHGGKNERRIIARLNRRANG